MTVSETLNEVVEEMRNKYCKFPETWDEDKEGVDFPLELKRQKEKLVQ